jgi:hypothetical protein
LFAQNGFNPVPLPSELLNYGVQFLHLILLLDLELHLPYLQLLVLFNDHIEIAHKLSFFRGHRRESVFQFVDVRSASLALRTLGCFPALLLHADWNDCIESELLVVGLGVGWFYVFGLHGRDGISQFGDGDG